MKSEYSKKQKKRLGKEWRYLVKKGEQNFITQCICDNCTFFNIFDVIVTFDSRGYMKYRCCRLEKKYVRFNWTCQNWKRKLIKHGIESV